MATKYKDIHDAFLYKISDLELPMFDTDVSNNMINRYLKSAIARSARILKRINFSNTISVSESDCCDAHNNGGFVDTFTDEELDVLLEWMIVFWLEPYVNNSELFYIGLSTADFKIASSPANLFGKLCERHKMSKKDALSLMNKYSFIYSDIERLKP